MPLGSMPIKAIFVSGKRRYSLSGLGRVNSFCFNFVVNIGFIALLLYALYTLYSWIYYYS